jgi:hypothetical protein
MPSFYKLLIIFFLLIFPYPTKAHVLHYENLNSIEFDIYRNNKHIGKHIFTYERKNNQLFVKSNISFEIKKLGIVLYKYFAEGIEVFENGELIKFNSKTDQNGKKKFVNIVSSNTEIEINGSSFKGKASKDFMLGTWWNHSLVKAKAQISAVSGRIIHQNVEFLGKEVIKILDKEYKTLHFNFSSTDKNLKKNKRLNTDVWYDETTLNWVKASFKKNGNWEYRLISIK